MVILTAGIPGDDWKDSVYRGPSEEAERTPREGGQKGTAKGKVKEGKWGGITRNLSWKYRPGFHQGRTSECVCPLTFALIKC